MDRMDARRLYLSDPIGARKSLSGRCFLIVIGGKFAGSAQRRQRAVQAVVAVEEPVGLAGGVVGEDLVVSFAQVLGADDGRVVGPGGLEVVGRLLVDVTAVL